MSAVLAVNIGYSPRHAAPPPGPRSLPPPRRRRTIIGVLTVCALLGAGTTVMVLRVRQQAASCSRATGGAGCRQPTMPQVPAVYSSTKFGFREPADMALAAGNVWITNQAGNSVTGFGWRSAGHPVVLTGPSYGFAAPGPITTGHDHLWIGNTLANSITEVSATDRSVTRKIADVPTPDSLVLFGKQLWVANAGANSVSAFSVRTGALIRTRHGRGLDHPDALAVSN